MYTVYLVTGIVSLITFISVLIFSEMGAFGRFGMSLISSIIAAVITFLIMLTVMFFVSLQVFSGPYKYKWVKKSSTTIVSMKDSLNQGIYGSFFLGSGSISSDDPRFVYTYAVKTSEGIIPRHLIEENSNVIIKEDIRDGQVAHLDIFHKERLNLHPRLKSRWLLLVDAEGWDPTGDYKYYFHVPPDSIVRESKIDLE